jgi:branched-chain amino acid transport system ATP-binding protein
VTAALLEASEIRASYGPVQALEGVSAATDEHEVVALIGANGAGKTTLLNCLSGAMAPRGGAIRYRGEDITRLPAHRRVGLGISHVPERRQIFGPLSVIDNLLLGGYARVRQDGRRSLRPQLDVVFELFPVLADRQQQTAGTLSGGEQQMLALGRGLMARPRVMAAPPPTPGPPPPHGSRRLRAG